MNLSDHVILAAFSAGQSVTEMHQRCLSDFSCDSQEFSDKLASLLQRGLLESSGEGLCLSREGESYLASLEGLIEEAEQPQSSDRCC